MDAQFLKCHSNTRKCLNVEDRGEWECRDSELYVAPKEIPRSGTVLLAKVVRRKGKYTVGTAIEINTDMVRKCFSKVDEYVEEGG